MSNEDISTGVFYTYVIGYERNAGRVTGGTMC